MEPVSFSRVGWRRTVVTAWVIANLFGVVTFLLWTASCCWIEPELKDVPGASGGMAFVWALGPLPLLAVFVLEDFAWAAVVERRSLPERRWKALAIPLTMLGF